MHLKVQIVLKTYSDRKKNNRRVGEGGLCIIYSDIEELEDMVENASMLTTFPRSKKTTLSRSKLTTPIYLYYFQNYSCLLVM